jgi:hypothetical protein
MCGEAIGSGGGHRIARTDQGARRLMSSKFVDGNGNFYTHNQILQNLVEFWDAQRCYVTAEMNRMKTKKEVTWKPMIEKKRV